MTVILIAKYIFLLGRKLFLCMDLVWLLEILANISMKFMELMFPTEIVSKITNKLISSIKKMEIRIC